MRCLYCGKQLPLLKKLTGGGEFCSEAHRQKYQEEYNKLALSRLLQTQNTDFDAPHRGELILASRQHPALLAGRPPLRALEAPKPTDSPLAGNWAPGANRTQRALPPPSNPQVQQPSFLRNELPKIEQAPPGGDLPSLARPLGRPLPPAPLPDLARQDLAPRDLAKKDLGRPEPLSRFDPAKHSGGKKDAFSFRPIDPFPVEKPPPPPAPAAEAPPATPPQPAELAPKAAVPVALATRPIVQAKAPEPPSHAKQAPPEGPFIVEEVRRPEPPPIPKIEQLREDVFTDGRPPKPDGWGRWEPDIQAPPGRLEAPDRLLLLPGPPGKLGEKLGEKLSEDDPLRSSGALAVRATEEQPHEREEIRKKILENQVKPGDFKQMVPTAPSGPATVLPICPPAAALERVPVSVIAKAPTASPSLYLAPAANGEDLWAGWSISGMRSVRTSLTLIHPEVTEPIDLDTPVSPIAATPVAEAPKPLSLPATKPSVATAKLPVADATRNYRAAEALKSAAQAVVNESAPKAVPVQPDKPSTPRHEVFVDLSVLGIEEDEDAEAEFSAREGESPPGDGRLKGRRRVAPVEAARELVSLPHPPASPVEPKPAQNFQALAWKHTVSPSLRLVGLPLRPKIVFAQTPPATGQEQSPKPSSSLASAWSAKRLKKVETGAPPSAPGNSGQPMPVEIPVSEPLQPVPAAPSVVETTGAVDTARVVTTETKTAKIETVTPQAAPSIARVVVSKPAVVAQILAEATASTEPGRAPAPAFKPAIVKQVKVVVAREESKKAEVEAPAPSAQDATGKNNDGRELKKKDESKGALSPTSSVKLSAPEPLPSAPPFEAPILGAGLTNNGSFWANLPVLPKIALALSLLAAVAGGAWFTLRPPIQTSAALAQKSKTNSKTGRSLLLNLPGGWSPDWGGDFNRKKNRTISFYRPSVNNDDYRMEFEGQVESKAVGWIYRAMDTKNYYAYKVEFVKTGPDPGVALTHFTMVNGIESQKHYTPLSKPIRSGVGFKVRLDVKGDEFSAYINDELIEVWQDDRLPRGGFGLMTELGEVGQVRKLQVFELMP